MAGETKSRDIDGSVGFRRPPLMTPMGPWIHIKKVFQRHDPLAEEAKPANKYESVAAPSRYGRSFNLCARRNLHPAGVLSVLVLPAPGRARARRLVSPVLKSAGVPGQLPASRAIVPQSPTPPAM